MSNIVFPELNENQYAVCQADVRTGKLHKTDGSLYRGEGNCFFIFDSLMEARMFVSKELRERPLFEFCIKNYKNETIDFIRDEDFIKSL